MKKFFSILVLCVLLFSTKTNAQHGRITLSLSVGGNGYYPQQQYYPQQGYYPSQQQIYIREIRNTYYNSYGQVVNREDPGMVFKTIMSIDNYGRVVGTSRLNVVNRYQTMYYNMYRTVVRYNNGSEEIF